LFQTPNKANRENVSGNGIEPNILDNTTVEN